MRKQYVHWNYLQPSACTKRQLCLLVSQGRWIIAQCGIALQTKQKCKQTSPTRTSTHRNLADLIVLFSWLLSVRVQSYMELKVVQVRFESCEEREPQIAPSLLFSLIERCYISRNFDWKARFLWTNQRREVWLVRNYPGSHLKPNCLMQRRRRQL